MVLAVTYDNALQFNSTYFWYTEKCQINGECRTLSHWVKNNMQRPSSLSPNCSCRFGLKISHISANDISKTFHLHNLPLLNYMLYIYIYIVQAFLQVHPYKPRLFSWGLPYIKAAPKHMVPHLVLQSHHASVHDQRHHRKSRRPLRNADVGRCLIPNTLGLAYLPTWMVDCYGKCR